MPFLVLRGGSFVVHIGDHLRFGIICGPIWGSFAVGDHLRRCTGRSQWPIYLKIMAVREQWTDENECMQTRK